MSKLARFFCWIAGAVNLALLISLVIALLTGDGFHKGGPREPIHPAFAILSVAWLLATCVAIIWPLSAYEKAREQGL
jgi:hypothetical protein